MKNDFLNIPFEFKGQWKEELERLLPFMGTSINFEDIIWRCNKLKKNEIQDVGKWSIYYTNTPKPYFDVIRYFALSLYKKGNRIKTIKLYMENFITFLQFLMREYNSIDLELVDYIIMSKYEEYLNLNYSSSDTKNMKWSVVSNFFKVMKNADGKFRENPVTLNPFEKKRNDSDKYIDKYILKQTDVLFKSEDIPLHIRVEYWIMRFIPSRLGEVVELKLNCIKPTDEGWVLITPTWKDNGGYDEPQMRTIRFKKDSIEANFLFELIKRQQKIAESLQEKLEPSKKGYLFTYYTPHYLVWDYKKYGIRRYSQTKDISVASYSTPTKFFRQIGERYNIIDKNGNKTYFNSYNLRHTGITDRLHEGFNIVDIKAITNNKDNKSIEQNYFHPQKEILIQKQRSVFAREMGINPKNDELPILFQGRILNINDTMEKRLLRNMRAHKLKYGICSDITGCKHVYDCLACKYFIPNAEDLDYFEQEVIQWTEKVKFFKKQNHSYMVENAMYNLKLNQKIVDRIKSIDN